jgi:hypothetical protein
VFIKPQSETAILWRKQPSARDGLSRARVKPYFIDFCKMMMSLPTNFSDGHLPDAIIGGEISALDQHCATDFRALQAAFSARVTDALAYFSSTFCPQAPRICAPSR